VRMPMMFATGTIAIKINRVNGNSLVEKGGELQSSPSHQHSDAQFCISGSLDLLILSAQHLVCAAMGSSRRKICGSRWRVNH
jgi:hypothetical protein